MHSEALGGARRGRLRELAQGPLVALELLTVLRLRRPPLVEERALGESQAYFPLVGLLLGATAGGLAALLDDRLSASLIGWLAVGALALLSGGLHIDGLADTADGLGGGRTREQRLSIMRDGAVGAFGAAAVVVVLGIKASAIAALGADLRFEALAGVLCVSRAAMVVAIVAYPYARPSGLGQAFHGHALPWAAPVALTLALAVTAALLGGSGVALCAIGLATGLGCGRLVVGQLGGLTGDVYGALNEVTEAALLVVLAAGWLT